MSDFLKYIRSIFGLTSIEDRTNLQNRKRHHSQESDEHSSTKFRRLNEHKMNSNLNDNWREVPLTLKQSYLRHFPKYNDTSRQVQSRPKISSHNVCSNVIDLSNDDDCIDITPQKSPVSILSYSNFGSARHNYAGLCTTRSPKFHPPPAPVIKEARRTINNCNKYLNKYSAHNATFRPEERDLYKDMLLNSPRTSAVYASKSPITRNVDYSETNMPKDIMEFLKEKCYTSSLIDLTDEKSEKLEKSPDTITIKDSDSETDSSNHKIKLTSVNSLQKMLCTQPCMDPNFIKKLETESKSKRLNTERLIQEEKMKRDKFSELNKENVSLLLASKIKNCKITDVIVLEDEYEEELFFPDLTSDQEIQINEAFKMKHSNRLFNEKYNLRITGSDLRLLREKEWLNDELINFYVNMIQERSHNLNMPCVYAFSTFFYPKLVSSGYSSLSRWTKRIDIFDVDIIIIPVHLGFHWCMATIDFRDKSIRYYDSMLGNNKTCLKALEKYLQEEHWDKKKLKYDTSDWQKVIMTNIPRQMNGSDCGVFSCTFAEFITRNANIKFTQEHMPYIRQKMVIEIIEGQLLT